MEFLTLHELSVHLDVSVRVLRSRLKRCLQEGRLVEGRDCLRENYSDETHFLWRVDPSAFGRATGFQAGNHPVATADRPGTGSPPARVPTGTAPEAAKPAETLISVDSPTPTMAREMIDLLKEQAKTKDGQIADLTAQTKTLVSLNERLTGAMVHHTEQIKTLLQLTGGRMEPEAPPPRSGNQTAATGYPHTDSSDNHG